MTSDNMFFDAAAVSAAMRSLDVIHQSLESGLSVVSTEAEALIADGWAGTAADAFRDHFHQIRAEAEQLLVDAREIAGMVPAVVDRFTVTDKANSDQLVQAPSSLKIQM
ncbi:hypothetical protein FEK35_28195 [Nocardia cyriacigeorgica]|uniref:ESAT-6-like protein n=1 Tax=Nocardia cyriacigeorgica TaxID=135487 RepID=A0A5R8P6D0_9NOCA|nr:WXG100 family type VII secretion target [Nocardia cyriacigeorgica]TLF96633.1 hypothetical protein FEK35_28195 [Nocardia cyriacigeorgica]